MTEVNQEAVNPAASAPAETNAVVNNEPAQTTQQAQETNVETTPQTTISPIPAQGESANESVDEFGVPYKNRAMEWKRKSEELTERLPSLLEEAVSTALSKQGNHAQAQEPTIEQLELYKIENQNSPQAVAWAEAKKEEIRQKNIVKEIETRLNKNKEAEQADRRKQGALQYVMSTYPDAFIKDSQGNITGWNTQSPFTQSVFQKMQDKRLKDDPDGLAVAADLTYARFVRGQQPLQQMKVNSLKAEVKDLQKKTLVEAGTKQTVQVVPEHRALLEKAKQTGSVKDAAAALAAMAKYKASLQEK